MPGILFFDGDCGMCTQAVNLLLRINRTGALRTEPLQRPGTAERLGAPREELMESIWWLRDDGTVLSAAHAANAAVSAALGTSIPMAVYHVPGIRQIQELIYRWVAGHRQYFPGTTPHCAASPGDCAR